MEFDEYILIFDSLHTKAKRSFLRREMKQYELFMDLMKEYFDKYEKFLDVERKTEAFYVLDKTILESLHKKLITHEVGYIVLYYDASDGEKIKITSKVFDSFKETRETLDLMTTFYIEQHYYKKETYKARLTEERASHQGVKNQDFTIYFD